MPSDLGANGHALPEFNPSKITPAQFALWFAPVSSKLPISAYKLAQINQHPRSPVPKRHVIHTRVIPAQNRCLTCASYGFGLEVKK
jgi:hypothetical protein